MRMRYLPLGNTREIGASCHYLLIDGVGIVLDAGVDPEQEGRASLPDLRLIRRRGERPVDHVIITHAHHDHMGSLPVLLADHPHARVHLTPPTRLLAETLLPASARLQRRKLSEGSTTEQPIFDVETAEALSYVYEERELGDTFKLPGTKGDTVVKARLYHAGHTLGSASVLLEANGRRVFYTSDIHLADQVLIPGAELPDGPINTLFLETTLGADPEAEQFSRKAEERRLGEAIARVLDRGGSVLIPAFALGRAQEMLALLDHYKRRGIIPDETPIYTTGQQRAVAEIYDRTRTDSPRRNREFEVFGVEQERTPRRDSALAETLHEPCIHVASSGMMFERTLSNALARMMVEDERHGIFFVGFSKEGSPGARLLEAAAAGDGAEIVLDAQEHPEAQKVRAEVERFRFSGHAHRQELVDLAVRMDPKQIVLVHGETEAKEWMLQALAEALPGTEVLAPGHGEEVEL
jgi:cleavage and polyadenylation specificity factor subunit 3